MLKNHRNESDLDRGIRIAVGIIAAILGYTSFTGVMQSVLYIVAFLGIFTGITGVCLIYKIFGINTYKKTA